MGIKIFMCNAGKTKKLNKQPSCHMHRTSFMEDYSSIQCPATLSNSASLSVAFVILGDGSQSFPFSQ